jgi:hypothetical protein
LALDSEEVMQVIVRQEPVVLIASGARLTSGQDFFSGGVAGKKLASRQTRRAHSGQ